MKKAKRDYRHAGRIISGRCVTKGCPGPIREVWQAHEWIEGKCDKCGAEVGFPLIFSIPAQKGQQR